MEVEDLFRMEAAPVCEEFDSLPAYHFAMFEIELSRDSNMFYRLLAGIISIDLSSSAEEKQKSKWRAISHLNKAKNILQQHLNEISNLINNEEYKEIYLDKKDQPYNFGDNMMQKHLESEQSLIIATIAHAESLTGFITSNSNKQVALKKTYRFEQIIGNGLETDISINGISTSEIALADAIGLGVYYEIEALANLGINDPEVNKARAKIMGGAAMLLTAYIPQTRLIAPIVAVPAGRLIRSGAKKLLSLIFNDPNINDEVEDIEDYVTDIATSFGGPAIAVPKILTTILMQVGQSFLVNYLIKHFGQNLLDWIKQWFINPIKGLIEEPLKKICEWKQDIFNSLKSRILDPIKLLFQRLLNHLSLYGQDTMGQISKFLNNSLGLGNTQENSIIKQMQEAKLIFLEVMDDIVWVKNTCLTLWHNGVEIFNQFKAIKNLKNIFQNFKAGSIKAIKSLIECIVNFIRGDLFNTVNVQINKAKNIVGSIIKTIPQYIKKIIENVKKIGGLIADIITYMLNDPIQFFYLLISNMTDFARQILAKGYNFLADIMRGIMSKIEGIFDIITLIRDKISKKIGIGIKFYSRFISFE